MATPPPPYPQPCPEFHRFGPTGRSLGLSMGSGEVLPDLPAYAGVCKVVWSYPITLHMLECTWSGPTRSPDIFTLWARHIRSASLLLPSPLLGSYDPTWVWAADDAKVFI